MKQLSKKNKIIFKYPFFLEILLSGNYKFHHYIIKINVDIDKASLVAFLEGCQQLLIYETQSNHSTKKIILIFLQYVYK